MTTSASSSNDSLVLYGQRFDSRLLLGTSRYPSPAVLEAAVQRARPAMVTASLRRQGSNAAETGASFWELLKKLDVPVLPNTAGCMTVQEAVTTAQMAREVFETPWIKLELIGDDYTLQPDTLNRVEAASILNKDGFRSCPTPPRTWCCASAWSMWAARPSCPGPLPSARAAALSIPMPCRRCASA
jgi:thiazole synthase